MIKWLFLYVAVLLCCCEVLGRHFKMLKDCGDSQGCPMNPSAYTIDAQSSISINQTNTTLQQFVHKISATLPSQTSTDRSTLAPNHKEDSCLPLSLACSFLCSSDPSCLAFSLRLGISVCEFYTELPWAVWYQKNCFAFEVGVVVGSCVCLRWCCCVLL